MLSEYTRDGYTGIYIANLYAVHIGPGLSCLLNFVLTDVVMKRSHSRVLLIITIFYVPMNYYGTKAKGEPIYSFLTWENEKDTLLVVAFIYLMVWLAYQGLCLLTEWVKRGNATPVRYGAAKKLFKKKK